MLFFVADEASPSSATTSGTPPKRGAKVVAMHSSSSPPAPDSISAGLPLAGPSPSSTNSQDYEAQVDLRLLDEETLIQEASR